MWLTATTDARSWACCTGLEAVCSVLLLALILSGNTNVLLIFGVLVLFGIARAFVFPAGIALMPNLVPQHHYVNAAAWSSSAWQTATIAGPAVGGMLYALGPAVVYGVSGLLLLGSSLLVVSIRIQRVVSQKKSPELGDGCGRYPLHSQPADCAGRNLARPVCRAAGRGHSAFAGVRPGHPVCRTDRPGHPAQRAGRPGRC